MRHTAMALMVMALGVTGCGTTRSTSMLLREGYRDIQVGQPAAAERRAVRILKDQEYDPAALVLLARARLSAGDREGALEALETLDYTNVADWACPDRVSLHEGYLLKTELSGNLRMLRKADTVRSTISQELESQRWLTLVRIYENQKDPVKAAEAFARYENTQEQLEADELLHGFVLYYATLRADDAKRLWGQLNPQQKEQVKTRYGEIQL